MDKQGYTPSTLSALNRENFENKSYTIDAIEDNMDLKLISFMKDIPYCSTVLESIFSLNPYATTEKIIQKLSSYRRLNEMPKEFNEDFCKALWEVFCCEEQFYEIKNKELQSALDTIYEYEEIKSISLVGETVFRQLVCIVDGRERAKQIAEQIVENEYTKKQDELLIFDDFEKYVCGSSVGGGFCYFDFDCQLWF